MAKEPPKSPPRYEESTDQELMLMVQQPDERALDALFMRYVRRVYGFVTNFVEKRQDAEEIACDVFFRVFRYRRSWNPAYGNFRAWLFMIARNTVLLEKPRTPQKGLDELRKNPGHIHQEPKQPSQILEEEEEDKGKTRTAWLEEKHAQVDRDCKILRNETLKRIARLRIKKLLKYGDIAKTIGFSYRFVEQQIVEIKREWKERDCKSYEYLMNTKKATHAKKRTAEKSQERTRKT